ncbi:hypothetical protein ACFWSF_09845 [Streptomyces sp. NPDC058611]|uniref:hypothetical protein n=1 Tax=unclassified Streptomyces TaxID=2593676 RepID=UPI0036517305
MTSALSKVAWDHCPTTAGYRRLAFRRAAWLGCLTSACIVAVACVLGLVEFAPLFPVAVIALLSPFLPVVAIAYWRRQRIASVLQAYPWREVHCQHDPRRPSVISIGFSAGFAPTFRMFPFPVQLTDRESGGNGPIWFAGDPRFGGVVSPVGGHYPVRVVPDEVPAEGWSGGDDGLALRVGLMRRSGKGTRT